MLKKGASQEDALFYFYMISYVTSLANQGNGRGEKNNSRSINNLMSAFQTIIKLCVTRCCRFANKFSGMISDDFQNYRGLVNTHKDGVIKGEAGWE